ncbi:hypothetical protein NQ317_010815 [Molorchus minor]|uniref:N-acetyltransferase domain-containing protein n=1 Tax=Molorchus minor TaxID=1323400 RepID=A0ABQ9JSP5_9CUCU|nr:hypothetical protein NQ317_010815 [Molorchus minor]
MFLLIENYPESKTRELSGINSAAWEIRRGVRYLKQIGEIFLILNNLFQDDPFSRYIYLRATKNDYQEIINLMHTSYYPDEPTCACLNITENPLLDESALHSLAEGTSMVARCKFDGTLAGACINESTSPWDPDIKEKIACGVNCEQVKRLLLFYAHMQRLPDVWNKYSVQKVFEMSQLFVTKCHRKKGIGFRLLKHSRALAADCGYKVVRCDATSEYTAKLCKRMGMKKIAEIPYCSYLESEKLEPVFQPAHPHKAVKIFVDINPQKKPKKVKSE